MDGSRKLAGLALAPVGLILCLSLAACDPIAIPGNSDAIHLTVWVVPESARVAKIQVRLAPQVPVASAKLEASSAAAAVNITPAQFTLTDLEPAEPGGGKAHNPPVLGMTLLRTFTLRAARPGRYQVTVKLSYGQQVETRRVTVDFTDGKAAMSD